MRSILEFTIRFLKLDHQNMIPEVPFFAGVVWIVLLVCMMLSISSQQLSRSGKLIWAVVVIFLPLVGGVAYCFYCLSRQDYSFLKVFTGDKVAKTRRPNMPPMRAGATSEPRS